APPPPGAFPADAGTASLLHVDGRRIAVAGLGDEIDADAFRSAAAAVARLLHLIGGALAWVPGASQPPSPEDQARAVVDGVVLGGYDPGRWKSSGDRWAAVERLVFLGPDAVAGAGREQATVAAWVNRARDLANEPPNELTPARMAEHADEIAAGLEHLSAESWGPERLAELGMGAFSAVGQGSHHPPRAIDR